MFQQLLNPAGNLWLSVLISLVPLVALLFMLAVLRMTAWLATIVAGVITIPLGVLVWHAPLGATLKSYLYGGLTGVWVIDWITFWGLIIFNTLVLTGDFERFKSWIIHHATADIRIQTIMLAWAFGALLEGLGRVRLPVGGSGSDSCRTWHCRFGRDPRGRAGEQCARILWGAGRPDSRPGRGNRAAADGAFRIDRQHRRGARNPAALDSDLPGQRVGRSCRGLAAGDRRLAFLHRGAMAGGALSWSLPARPERSAGLVLDSCSFS